MALAQSTEEQMFARSMFEPRGITPPQTRLSSSDSGLARLLKPSCKLKLAPHGWAVFSTEPELLVHPDQYSGSSHQKRRFGELLHFQRDVQDRRC